jgi:tRNA/rRNA methyltransferase
MAAEFDRLCVVLVGTRNPLNLGAAARAMSNFGFRRLRVVRPYPVAFREARSAVGASAVLGQAEEFEEIADAVADCALVVGTTSARNRELHHPLRLLNFGARAVRRELGSDRVALLFGSEKVGLSNQALSYCNWLLQIPTREEHPSMNLGQAVAVCLYELARSSQPAEASARRNRAAAGELKRIDSLLLNALEASGYLKSAPNPLVEAKLRRLIRRFDLRPEDAAVLLGMLRQIVWKLGPSLERQTESSRQL